MPLLSDCILHNLKLIIFMWSSFVVFYLSVGAVVLFLD